MPDHEAELRAWARGLLPLEAATELLIRAGWAGPGRGWVHRDDSGRGWINFSEIPDMIGGYSGGEQRLLMIAASLGADQDAPVTISLPDELPGLDREHAELVLAAIAHAAGFHEPGRTIEMVHGAPRIVDVDALYTWPDGGQS
ncbi:MULTISPECIES: ATP-binding cassette domain-containing protein [unclassified Microbacterium]|uniref:ATP-binding cassette domain-containing protein n=1 Tax=unclassified Microbacterium TaxID=2609290 RepID=UPI0030181369